MALTTSLPSSVIFPSLATGGGVDINVSFGAEHSIDTYSQHFDQLGVSALTTEHCRGASPAEGRQP